MVDDLISRQAAIDAIVNNVSEIGLHDNSEVARYGATFRQHEIIDIIECVPSAQEIVLCKDCKSHRLCAIEHEVLRESDDTEFFCKWGERG